MKWTFSLATQRVMAARCYPTETTLGDITIKVLRVRPSSSIGIRTWGAIDYLRGVHGYVVRMEKAA